MKKKLSRRSAFKSIAGSTAAVGVVLTGPVRGQAAESKVKGNIRHSVCKWCYGSTGLEKLAAKAASLGMESVELLDPSDFPTMRKHDLMCAKLIKKKRLLFGTIDCFLLWRLTGGTNHFTDATNASRTMLYNISSNKWDNQILDILKIPHHILPEVKDCSDNFGHTDPKITGESYSITGMVGDQQAATIGQCCFEPGSLKSTYGTGAFVLLNTGNKIIYSKNRLLTTIGYRLNGKTTYALEGSIFIAGAGVQWLRDKVKFLIKASDSEKVIKKLKNNHGVYLVPAFTGIGAPYWNSKSRGVLSGLTRDTGISEIIRATVESVGYQTYDLFEAMKNDGLRPKIVRVDGGMVKNNWFSQFLSDVINVKVLRPKVDETTALGAAFMAGLKVGIYKSLNDISKNWSLDKKFSPKMKNPVRKKLINGWQKAIKRALIT